MNKQIPIAVLTPADDSWTAMYAVLEKAFRHLHALEGKLKDSITAVVREVHVPYRFPYMNKITEYFGTPVVLMGDDVVRVFAGVNYIEITLDKMSTDKKIGDGLGDDYPEIPEGWFHVTHGTVNRIDRYYDFSKGQFFNITDIRNPAEAYAFVIRPKNPLSITDTPDLEKVLMTKEEVDAFTNPAPMYSEDQIRRDYFTMAALIGLGGLRSDTSRMYKIQDIADDAVLIADAVIKRLDS